ncbi:MAG: hypothetical protein HPY62_11395 [Bacteroidales bacterium]|nr:hypothetical protein [Bacteroidales bacterium]
MKPRFESIINSTDLISKTDKKLMLKYIDFFYTVIEDKNLISSEFLSVCETRKDYNLPE